ncbi:hypothetical protein THAOC_33512, partial [Thalassiosira oceanica]
MRRNRTRAARSSGADRNQLSAAMEDEVAIIVHGVFPLPMGMKREDR